jgi:hypothetical protein
VFDEELFRAMAAHVRAMPSSALPIRDSARILCAFSLARARAGSRLTVGPLFRQVSVHVLTALPTLNPTQYRAADISALARSARAPAIG